MAIKYFLVAGETRLDVGADRPAYSADKRAWATAIGRVSAWEADTYKVEAVAVADEGQAPDPGTLQTIARQLELVVDHHINEQAKALGYESIVTAVSYAGEPAVPKFQAEGIALRAWRSLVYARAYELQTEAMQGLRPVPSTTELIALLPAFVVPT